MIYSQPRSTPTAGWNRWNQLNTVSARLIQGGALWALKGQAGVLDGVVVTRQPA